MMKKPKTKINEVSQEIDLNEVLKFDFSGKRALKELLGEAILQRIRERSAGGDGVSIDSRGYGKVKPLKAPYSDEYIESDEFKIHGKSKNEVNMELTGDMLGLMNFEIKGNKIKIGWDDSTENAKAFNHMTGDTVPKRPFFGVSRGEVKELAKGFRSELKAALELKDKKQRDEFNSTIFGLIDQLRGEGDGNS